VIEAAAAAEYDLMPAGEYPFMPVETSRGCRFDCIFCSVPRRRHWEGLDAGWAADRILDLVERHGHRFTRRTLYFVDD